jgi:type I restriction enzyme S subunit
MGYTRFLEKDIVVPKITPTFQADRTTIATGLDGGVAAGTTELHVVRVGRNVDRRYVRYLLSSRPFLHGGAAEMIGVAGQKRVPDEWLRNLRVPVLPVADQRAIAAFLDAETARIDALIDKKRALAELMAERFRARSEKMLLACAVDNMPLMNLTDPYRPIVYGIVQAGPDLPEGVPYIKTGDLSDLRPESLSRTAPEIDEQYSRARVKPGDLVVAMRASIGQVVMVPSGLHHANLTQGTARIAAARGVNPTWLLHAFRTAFVQEQCRVRAVGTTFKTLNIWDLRRVLIPFSPQPHQDRLADLVRRHEHTTLQLNTALRRQIALLHERRQALITAAVTGQLDIPGLAA